MIAGLVHTRSTFRVLRYLRRYCHLQRVRPSGVRKYDVKELTAVLFSGSDHPLSVFISKQQSTRGHIRMCGARLELTRTKCLVKTFKSESEARTFI